MNAVAAESIQPIPLASLRLSPLNRRKTGGTNVADLVASIPAHGLLQNLTVIDGGAGVFEVVAGGRRLRALQQLEQSGHLPPELLRGVPCKVISNGSIVEASTAENTAREPMHPADQFDAFKAMVDGGKPVAEIAAHFSVAEIVVKQRLKLANVSPKIMAEYRDGKASLEQLQALALTDDHKAQEKVWFGAKDSWQRNTHQMREQITRTEIPSTDPRVQFVGLDAYEAAGGAVRRDLFDTREGGYVADSKLLNRLVDDRLQALVDVYKGQGWSWVEAHTKLDYAAQSAYGWTKHDAAKRKPTAEEQQRLSEIKNRQGELRRERDRLEESADSAMTAEEFDSITASIDAEDDALTAEAEGISNGLESWPASAKQEAGVLIYLERGRGLVVEPGRLRPGQGAKGAKGGATAGGAKGKSDGKPKKPELSDAMVHRLTAHRTVALQLQLARSPDTALRVLVDHMLTQLLFTSAARRALGITASNNAASIDLRIRAGEKEFEASPARIALKALVESWRKRGLPTQAGAVRAWVFKLDRNVLVELLALATALTVDAEHGTNGKRPDADAIAEDLKLNMADFWQPSPAFYLEHVSKALAIEAVAEVCGKAEATTLETLKRDAVVAEATKKLHGKGWLPKPLRGAGYKLAGASAKSAASKPAAKSTGKKVIKKPAAKKAAKKARTKS